MKPTNEKIDNNIPEDLFFCILHKLPVKSLKRFGCVNKSWAHLFENHHFMSMYRNNFISKYPSEYDNSCLILKQLVPNDDPHFELFFLSGERHENRVKLDWPPPFQNNHSNIFILGSALNGTLCVVDYVTKTVLWNPSTGEYKIIPPCTFEPMSCVDYRLIPTGFGYDCDRDDYKVIGCVDFFPYVLPGPCWMIYSQRSDSWRELNICIYMKFHQAAGSEMYLDGVCHWWGTGTLNNEAFLASFNLKNDVFLTTPLPLDAPFKSGSAHIQLAELNGSIALISNRIEEPACFHISILGELGVKESWVKLFIIGPLHCVVRPIGIGKKGDIFCRRKDDELIWFNLSTQMIEEFGVKVMWKSQILLCKERLLPWRKT